MQVGWAAWENVEIDGQELIISEGIYNLKGRESSLCYRIENGMI